MQSKHQPDQILQLIMNIETHLMQNVIINGQAIQLMFEVDIYVPHYAFQRRTDTTTESAAWLQNEKQHLLHHAVECL